MSKSLVKREDPMREVATVSQNQITQAITRFGQYIDRTGAKASSEKGMALSINGAIKKYYGKSRDEMPRDMLLHCSSTLVRVVMIFEQGMDAMRDRADIKREIRAALKAGGESYHTMIVQQHVTDAA